MKIQHLIDKLKAQRQTLGYNLYVLSTYSDFTAVSEFDKEHRELIESQTTAMVALFDILSERIKLLNTYNQ